MSRTKKDILSSVEKEFTQTKIVGNNTIKIVYSDGTEAVRLHDTDIITYHPNGDIVLDSGGWRTATTKERINRFAPVWLSQNNHVWYVSPGNHVFYDGIRFDSNGILISEPKEDNTKELNKIKRRIAKYVKLIDGLDSLPHPNGGDCFYCSMSTVETGKPLGDAIGDKDHLLSHLDEGYIHGSIIVNAMREAGYQDQQIGFHYQIDSRWAIKNSLRKYLNKRLLPV